MSAPRTLPDVGTIWREHDKRFERFVRVVGWCDLLTDDPKVFIETVSNTQSKPSTGRTTKARPSAFGKRYRAVERAA